MSDEPTELTFFDFLSRENVTDEELISRLHGDMTFIGLA